MATDEVTRRRRRKPGDIASLRRTLWAGILSIEDLLAADDPAMRIRAAHALATLSGSYLKALEAADLEARIAALEARAAGVSPLRRTA